MGKKKKSFQLFSTIKAFRFLHIAIYILLCGIMFFAMYSNVKPKELNIDPFQPSKETIRSPLTIEDKESTKRKQDEAAKEVEDVYTLKKEYADNRVDLISSIFDLIVETNDEAEEIYNSTKKEWEKLSEEDRKNAPEKLTSSEKLRMLEPKLPADLTDRIPVSVFTALLEATPDQLSRAEDAIITAVNNIMKTRIPASEVQNAKKKIEEELRYTSVDTSLKNPIKELGQFAVIQNEYYDVDLTEEERQQAIDAVEPVKILQGQIIVKEGQLVSRDMIKQLKLVGLLNSDNSVQPFTGLMIIILLMMAAIIYYFQSEVPTDRNRNFYLLLFAIIFSITIVLMKMISLFQQIDYSEIGYIVPVAMGALLVKLLINEKVAIISSMIFAICGSIIFNEGVTGTLNFSIGVYFLFGSLAGILFLSKHNRRGKILQAGLFVSLINIALILSIMLLKNGNYSSLDFGSSVIMAVASGIIASVLTIGLLPFFEGGFGILSTIKLIELSNPNHPLLRKILTEAPGTYHHSVMVANLSESASEAIGENGLLARVASYYHDIGKTKRPHFFIENQMNIENPHDNIAPQLSKTIIVSHATDGAEVLRKYKMPKEIVDIAEQHHGTTLLKFFYHKAKQQSDREILESDFRYPGPKAQTKVATVIGIADSVEAAVRSMSNPTPQKIEALVNNIISDRLQDGQFDECDITLKELDIIAKALCESLNGIFHSRIEYPAEATKQKVKEA
ncbi:HD family phosphohydrolase [Fredinandcohnia quinoae]|uniref:HD family phosphohydrolase n=1 Tax=Fredinandcohnia quinoae TaxID=2918902 RepID=A0AAW5DWG4_9BACI|nr:HD family phosphohydrolase [Fredinandcohnia sp. SECRCQ15]MCH1624976.1 HD family phosphohydrolase [Fredinandcohnia sp. SECRCQ15]